MHSNTQHPINKEVLFSSLPSHDHAPSDLLFDIRRMSCNSRTKVVVLDDDPTGTQTVHNIPVLTHWSVDALTAELRSLYPAFYLLTNSRSLQGPQACRINSEIGTRLLEASQEAGVPITVISRSDSTLRGHFPGEVDALAKAMGISELPYLIIPCFFEGGRYTLNDVHYVAEGEHLVPAAETIYAKDATFGYRHSNLRRWIEEKTDRRISQEQITSVTLEDLRNAGPKRIARILSELAPGSACVVNAVSYQDLEVFVLGLLQAEHRGARFLFRTAASFVRVRCGLAPRDLLQADHLVANNPNGGLFVVGSHVPNTTAQVKRLMESSEITAVEIDVKRLLDDGERDSEVGRSVEAMNQAISGGKNALLFTSRAVIKGANGTDSLKISQRVSNSLIDIVKGLKHQPRYLVAKGGITSSDVATKALSVHRAIVLGQVLPGVPVWKLGDETRFPGMAYIVFPGNVGKTGALVEIESRLRV